VVNRNLRTADELRSNSGHRGRRNETRGGPDIQLIRPQELSFAPDGRAAGVGGTA